MNSPIIKKVPLKADLVAFSSNIAKKSVIDAQILARNIISEAEVEAKNIHSSAVNSASQIRDKAYKEGYEIGLEKFNQCLIELYEYRDRTVTDTEKDIIELSFKIAQKIIGHELERNNETIISIINTAIRNVRQINLITIKVNPTDLPIVQEYKEKIDPSQRAQLIDLVGDPQVSSGGCIIESEVGKIDARLETQLRVLERCLLNGGQ